MTNIEELHPPKTDTESNSEELADDLKSILEDDPDTDEPADNSPDLNEPEPDPEESVLPAGDLSPASEPRTRNKVERLPPTRPLEYEYDTVEVAGTTYERGQEIGFVPEEFRDEGEAKSYVVLCGTIDDEPGLVVQSVENPGIVFHIGRETVEDWVQKEAGMVETDERNEFNFRGQTFFRGESVRYTKEDGEQSECVVLGTVITGEGLILQSVKDPENPNDDHVFRVGKNVELDPIPPPPPPPEQMPDLIAMSTDEAMSQEARARSVQERIHEKQEFDQDKAEWTSRFPGFGRSKVGRALLSSVYAIRHPVQSIFRQNLLRNVIAERDYQQMMAGDRIDEIEFGSQAETATLERLSLARDAQERGSGWEAGQRLHGDEVLQESNPEVASFRASATELIRERALGNLSQADFEEAKERLFAETEWFRERGGSNGESVVHSVDSFDAVVEHLERMLATIEHTQAMERMDEALSSMRLITGETHIGARSESKLGWIDKVTDKVTRSKIGNVVPDQVLAVAVAAAGAITTRTATSGASKLVKWGTFGLGGVISGGGVFLRERLHLRQEESLVGREIAYGEQGPDAPIENTPIRERMTESQMDSLLSESAPQVVSELRGFIDSLPTTGGSTVLTAEQARTLLGRVSAVSTSLRWGDANGRDVMRYSSREQLDVERAELDESLIRARGLLQEHYESAHPEELPAGMSFDQLFESASRHHLEETLQPQAEEKQDTFNSFVQKRALVRGAATVAGGALIGLAVREGMDLVGDHLATPTVVRTPGESVILENEPKPAFGLDFQMPKAFKLDASPSGNGTMIVDTRNGSVIAEGLQTTEKGGFTPASIDLLQQKGIKVDTSDYVIAGPPQDIVAQPQGFAGLAKLPRVSRSWMDNDTGAPNFDRNELGMDWRIEGDQLVISADRMRLGGSFHEGYSVDPQAQMGANNGELLFSMTQDTQSTPFHVPLGTDGTVRLPINGPEVRNFFDLSGGDIKLKAAYIEVGTGRGVLPDGRVAYDILASEKGSGMSEVIIPDVPTEKVLTKTVLTAVEQTDPTVVTTAGDYVPPWLFLPVPMRLGVENIPRNRQQETEANRSQTGARVGENSIGYIRPLDKGEEGLIPPGVFDGGSREGRGVDRLRSSTNNKWWEVATDVPIDEQWVELWTGVKDRMEADGLEADDFWVEPGKQRNRPAGPPQLEAGPRPIAELPAKSEIISEVKESQSAIQNVKDCLTTAGYKPDTIVDDMSGITTRLRQGRYTREDLTVLRSALDLSERALGGQSNPDSFRTLRSIGATREWLSGLDAKFDASRQNELTIIYDLIDDVRKFETLGIMKSETRNSAFGLLGNMARRVREGKRLKPEEYQGLIAAVDRAALHTLEAIDESEKTALGVATSGDEMPAVRENYTARRKRLREAQAAKINALRGLEVLSRGSIEMGPVAGA